MHPSNTGKTSAHQNQDVVLRVRYAPAKAPYVDPKVSLTTTLADVKAIALKNFGLTEGTVDGGTKIYQLSFDDIVQTNLSAMLSSLETHGKQLELLLIEQFVQG